MNYNEKFLNYYSDYKDFSIECKELSFLINRDLIKINETGFFYFKISDLNLKNRYNDIIDYIEIKNNDLIENEEYEPFIIFYKIIIKINNKLHDCEEQIINNEKEIHNIKEKIKHKNNQINERNEILNNLNRKFSNNFRRNDKIKILLENKNNEVNERNLNFKKKLEDKINSLNDTMDYQKSKIYKLNMELVQINSCIDSLLKKIQKLKNDGNILYNRYIIKIREERTKKTNIIDLIEKTEDELKYNMNNFSLLNSNYNQLSEEDNIDNKNYNNFGIDIKEIDDEIYKIKKKEEENRKNITSLSKDINDLELKMNHCHKTIIKLKREKDILEDDLYHNQSFIKDKFSNIFNQKYCLDNIKKSLKHLINNFEKKNNLEYNLRFKYNPERLFELIDTNYSEYMENYNSINKNIDTIKTYSSINYSCNDKIKKLFLILKEEIVSLIDISYKFRIDNHNYFHIKNVYDYINDQNSDINYNIELNNLIDEEEEKILHLKTKIIKLQNENLEKQEIEKKNITNKYYTNISNDIINNNKLRHEKLILLKLYNKIKNNKEELDMIYNYLISSI